jgi:hypothetical protein
VSLIAAPESLRLPRSERRVSCPAETEGIAMAQVGTERAADTDMAAGEYKKMRVSQLLSTDGLSVPNHNLRGCIDEECELAHTPRDVMAVTAHRLGKLVTASASRRTNHTERVEREWKYRRVGVQGQSRSWGCKCPLNRFQFCHMLSPTRLASLISRRRTLAFGRALIAKISLFEQCRPDSRLCLFKIAHLGSLRRRFAEAMRRPRMRFVPIKTDDQLDMQC